MTDARCDKGQNDDDIEPDLGIIPNPPQIVRCPLCGQLLLDVKWTEHKFIKHTGKGESA